MLASDLVRSWIAMGSGFPAVLLVTLGMVWLVEQGHATRAELANLPLYGGWAALVIVWIILTISVYARAGGGELVSWLAATSGPRRGFARFWWSLNGGGAIWWAIAGASVTMYTLVTLALSPVQPAPALLIAGASVVVASAGMIAVAFAIHYGRIDALEKGFDFAGTAVPRFVDYLTLAVSISTTVGASDAKTVTSAARRAVAFHSTIALTFNTVLLALLVSVLMRGVQV